jgi:hypothetical protein
MPAPDSLRSRTQSGKSFSAAGVHLRKSQRNRTCTRKTESAEPSQEQPSRIVSPAGDSEYMPNDKKRFRPMGLETGQRVQRVRLWCSFLDRLSFGQHVFMKQRVRVDIQTIKLLVRLKTEKDRKRLSRNVSKTSKAMIRVNTRNAPESQPWNGNRHFKKSALFREVKLPNRAEPRRRNRSPLWTFFGGRPPAKILR